MSQFNVSTVFSAINHMTAPIRQMQNSVRQFTQQISHSNQQVNALGRNGSLSRLQVHFRNLRGLIKDTGSAVVHLGAKLAKLAMPGMGTLAVGAAAGYGISQLVENSMGFETNEIKTMALLRSRKENKQLPLDQIKNQSLQMIKDNQHFADTQVGETTDWNAWQANMLMNGLTPDNDMRKMAGTFGALHMGGMSGFNETIGSMLRGETGAADQIGQQMKSKNGVLSILDPKTEKYIELGAKGTIEFKNNLIKFLKKDAGNRFGFVSEMMGTSLDARISTIVSSFKTAFDEALRDTGWWEKSIKPFADAFNNSILRLKPKLKDFFDVLYQKLNNTGILDAIGNVLDTTFTKALTGLTEWIRSIDDKKLAEFKVWVESLPNKLKDVVDAGSTLIDFLQTLATVLNFFNLAKDYKEAETEVTRAITDTSYSDWKATNKAALEKPKESNVTLLQQFTSASPVQVTTTQSGNGPKVKVGNTGNNADRAQFGKFTSNLPR